MSLLFCSPYHHSRSVLEQALELLRRVPSIQGELEHNTRLLGVQVPPAVRVQCITVVNESTLGPARNNNLRAMLLRQCLKLVPAGRGPPASTHASQHEARSARLDSSSCKCGLQRLVTIEDIDLGQHRGPGDVEVGAAQGQDRRVVKDGLDVEEVAQVALLDRLERVEGVGVRLGGVEGAADTVVEDDHGAAVLGRGAPGQGDGLEQVDGAVGADGCGRAHGPDHHDGFLGFDCHVQKESRLLHGVRAVCDDCALAVRVVEGLLHHARQVEQDGGCYAARVDVGNLHALHVGHVPELRDGVDEDLDAEGPGLVARCLGIGRRRPGDGPARGEDGDIGETGVEMRLSGQEVMRREGRSGDGRWGREAYSQLGGGQEKVVGLHLGLLLCLGLLAKQVWLGE